MAMAMLASCVGPPPSPTTVIAPPPHAPSHALPSGSFVFRGTISQGAMLIGTAPNGTTVLTLDGEAVPLTSDGRFLIAFGRDHGPSATLIARRSDGSAITDTLAVLPRLWRLEELPIPKGTTPTPEFLAQRSAELAQIKAARVIAVATQSDGWRQAFIWPVTGRISGLFGAQRVYNGEKGSFHSGLDVAVPQGTPVRAPADGVVLLAASGDPFTLEGHLLMVGHGMGLDSAFLHLSHIDVKVGDVVRQGQVIGESGMSGRATGPHLHWALTWRGERIDPLLVAPPMPGAGPMTGPPTGM